jgi:hypothetical protein
MSQRTYSCKRGYLAGPVSEAPLRHPAQLEIQHKRGCGTAVDQARQSRISGPSAPKAGSVFGSGTCGMNSIARA